MYTRKLNTPELSFHIKFIWLVIGELKMSKEIKERIEQLKESQNVSYEEMLHIVSIEFNETLEEVNKVYNKESNLPEPWRMLVKRIEALFEGNMNKNKTLATRDSYEMLKSKIASWSQIKVCLGGSNNILLKELMSQDNFQSTLENCLKLKGIYKVPYEDYKYNRKIMFQKVA